MEVERAAEGTGTGTGRWALTVSGGGWGIWGEHNSQRREEEDDGEGLTTPAASKSREPEESSGGVGCSPPALSAPLLSLLTVSWSGSPDASPTLSRRPTLCPL